MNRAPSPVRAIGASAGAGGVDVAQLLHDIGEATASTDPLELFRLCLAAQGALLALDVPTGDEAALLAAFRTTDDRGRQHVRRTAIFQADRYPRQRPRPMFVPVAGAQEADAPLSRDEAQLLQHFRGTDDEGRADCVAAAAGIARVFPRLRAALTLVQAGQQQNGGRHG